MISESVGTDLPENWSPRALSELCSMVSGGTPPKSDLALWAGDVPWVSGKDLKSSRLSDVVDHITKGAAEAHSRIAPKGAVLALVRGMGLAKGFPISLIERPMAFNQDLKALIPNRDISGAFLLYALNFVEPRVLQNISNAAHGTKRLSQDDLNNVVIPVPPLDEQYSIALVLDAVRSARELARRTEEKSMELKRAAMRELFTRGLRGEPQKETEVGPIPESWSVAPIGRFTKLSQYGLSIRGNATGRYPILRMNCQEDGRVVLRDLQYVDLDLATAQSFRVNLDDLLFNRTNSYELVGRTAIVEGDFDAVFASYLIRLSIDGERLSPRYLNYFLNWDFAQSELKKLASRAVGQANINATKLSGFTVPVPTIDEQCEIVAILNAIDRKIGLNREKRTVLDDLFKALLHKLMTGKMRVGDLDLSALAPARVAEAAQ